MVRSFYFLAEHCLCYFYLLYIIFICVAGLDSFGNTKEPMYVMQEDPSSILANSSADLTAQSDIDGVYQDKRTWENQLARHILSGIILSSVTQ